MSLVLKWSSTYGEQSEPIWPPPISRPSLVYMVHSRGTAYRNTRLHITIHYLSYITWTPNTTIIASITIVRWRTFFPILDSIIPFLATIITPLENEKAASDCPRPRDEAHCEILKCVPHCTSTRTELVAPPYVNCSPKNCDVKQTKPNQTKFQGRLSIKWNRYVGGVRDRDNILRICSRKRQKLYS